jgi:hypothetical protein
MKRSDNLRERESIEGFLWCDCRKKKQPLHHCSGCVAIDLSPSIVSFMEEKPLFASARTGVNGASQHCKMLESLLWTSTILLICMTARGALQQRLPSAPWFLLL